MKKKSNDYQWYAELLPFLVEREIKALSKQISPDVFTVLGILMSRVHHLPAETAGTVLTTMLRDRVITSILLKQVTEEQLFSLSSWLESKPVFTRMALEVYLHNEHNTKLPKAKYKSKIKI